MILFIFALFLNLAHAVDPDPWHVTEIIGPLTDTELRASPVVVSGTVTGTVGLTDTQLRASPVAVSGPLTDVELRATAVPVLGPLTDTELRATAVAVSGAFFQVTQPVSGPLTNTELRATPVPVNGTITANAGTGVFAVSGPLTDTELRASDVGVVGPLTNTELRAVAVPVSGAFFQVTQPVSGPLTNTELRATPVPVSGTVTAVTGGLTDAELRATAVPVSGPLTDTQLRATPVPVSGTVTATGPLTDTQLRASAVPISVASLPLPSGASTSALQTSGNASLTSIDSKLTSPLAVTQSGTWNINDISGTISLPTGASTSALQTAGNASLTSIDSKLTSPLAVTGAFFQATQPVSGPLTDTQLRATPVPVSGTVTANAGTGTMAVSLAVAPTTPVTGTFFQATQPVSGPLTNTELRATAVPVSGPLTDTQLRATPVPVSGTITATTGGLTDTELRASPVPINGTVTANAGTGTMAVSLAVAPTTPVTGTFFQATQPVSGPLTDTQLRATPVPVSGTVAATQSGTWNINNISGTVSLPTGASTSALQTSGNASLTSIDGKLNSLGQKAMTASVPVVIASDQSLFPVYLVPNPTITPTISEGSTVTSAQADVNKTAYTQQSSDAQRSIVSSNASDTSAGTGLRTLKITYYDSTLAGPFTETLTLNGTTAVNTVATNICFIEKIEGLTMGSSGGNVGTISLKAAAAGAGATIGTIATFDNKTFWAFHYIPAGKTCNLQKITIAAGQASGATFQLLTRYPTTTGAVVASQIMRVANSSSFERRFAENFKIVGPARIVLQVIPDANSTTWYGSLEYFDN